MATTLPNLRKGHCACKAVTYEVLAPFLCVHCCHCTWCQRETGTAFVLNAIIESEHVRITSDTKPVFTDTPSASGDGQMMARCPKCHIVLYSDYDGRAEWYAFVRVGTLDDESKQAIKPDVHIYTSTKLPWLDLTSERERGVPVFEQTYESSQVWSAAAIERRDALRQKMKAAEAGQDGTADGGKE